MKSIIFLLMLTFSSICLFAQKETFDAIAYAAPKGWKKEVNENYINYSTTNNKTKTWCQIAIYKSTNSKGSIEKDFESEWQQLVATPFKITEAAQTNEMQETNGWKLKTGAGKFIFNGNNAMVKLISMSGYNRCVSILSVTNSQDYMAQIQSFLESVEVIKQQTVPSGQAENPQQQSGTNNNNAAIIGSWGKSNSVSQVNNRFGTYSYNKQQYSFNSNGTYRFTGKNYSEQSDETLLIKESGTYSINGNYLTINPQSSVIEAWSKRNGADNYNKLNTTQQRSLEKTDYQFSIVEKNLVLQTTKETVRDGRFSSGNSYAYGPPGTFTAIILPGE